jgi:hypothetical protein
VRRFLFLLFVIADKRRRSKRSRTINRGEDGDEERFTDSRASSCCLKCALTSLDNRLEREGGDSIFQAGSQ